MPLSQASPADLSGIPHASIDRVSPYIVQASQVITICIAGAAAFSAAYPFFGRGNWTWYEADDFFYYLKAASNFAHGLGSTFGGVPTNGFHPLWFLLIAAASRLSSTGSDMPVRIFLSAAIFISTLATYFLAQRLLPIRNTNPALSRALAGCAALYAMHLYCEGMEIILAIPLILAVALAFQSDQLWDGEFWPAARFGLLLSAMVLSRLDTGLIVVLLAAATVANSKLRSRVRLPQVLGTVLGLTPVALYVASNQIFFHTWMPVSGMAKQLKPGHSPSWPAWHSLLHQGLQSVFLLPILLAIVLFPVIYRALTKTQQVIYLVLLVFPFSYVLLLSCLSDWVLWPWYFYCLRPALCVSFAILPLWQPAGRVVSSRFTFAFAGLAVLGLTLYWVPRPSPVEGVSKYVVATKIRDFAVTHPGVYAMGDRAGIVGYLLPGPLVQTEGLMMDLNFLKLIQHKTPLREALADYNVRYYIASIASRPGGGCFHAVEPWQAGPKSPHMVADFCQPALATYTQDGVTTQIFDLDQSASTNPQLR